MADTVVTDAHRATPFSVVLSATGDDVAAPDTLTDVELLGYCAAGPLKEFLTRTADWRTFNPTLPFGVNCGKIHVRFLANNTPEGSPEDMYLSWEGPPNALQIGVGADTLGASSTIKIEIRLSHSMRY